MYRSDGEEAISYTVEDLLLFRESPFASWMERLTLENPLHGIAPDRINESVGIHGSFGGLVDSESLFLHQHCVESVQWSDLVRHRPQLTIPTPRQHHPLDFAVGDPEDIFVVKKMNDVQRRQETMDAMRSGVSIIVNAQLSVGPLSGDVDLLIRTSGVSELGNYLYLPCDTSDRESPHCALALCYAADLLHSMQGALPSHLLVIRGGQELVTLSTGDHIYLFQGVKQSFMLAQRSFRKHCMPNPEDSSSFGRWSSCANDVMKRRATSSSDEGSTLEDTGVDTVVQEGFSEVLHTATEFREPLATVLRGAVMNSKNSDVQSYVDLDWPGKRRSLPDNQIFNDTLMTSNGTDF